MVNVPSWRGKRFLELAAFRLGVAPKEEMDDHKAYYDPRDLWPLLVGAGFLPSEIKVTRHKGGLNTIARCRKPDERLRERSSPRVRLADVLITRTPLRISIGGGGTDLPVVLPPAGRRS